MRDNLSGGIQKQGQHCARASIVFGSKGERGGNSGGNVGRYVRSGMRGAVAKLYEASQAAARVAAVNTREYALQRVRGWSVIEGGGMVLGTADNHDPCGRSGMGDKGGCGIVRVDDDDDTPHKTMVLHGGWWAGRARHHSPCRQQRRQVQRSPSAITPQVQHHPPCPAARTGRQ
jgi:hypothetical protein